MIFQKNITVTEAHTEYLAYLESRGNSANDIKNHKYRVSSFCRFREAPTALPYGDIPMRKITPQMLDAWMIAERKRGIKSVTLNGYLQTIQFVEKFARERYPKRVGQPFSLHQKVKKGQARPDNKVLDNHSIEAMVNSAKQMMESGVLGQIASAVVFLTILETGIRNGEIKLLTLDRLGLDKPLEIEVDGRKHDYYSMTVEGVAKTGKSVAREAIYTEKLAGYLRQWLAVRPQTKHNYVFTRVSTCPWPNHAFKASPTCPHCLRHGLPHSAASVRKCNTHVALLADVPDNYLPHAIRHYVGRETTNEGNAKIAQLKLGHRKLATLLNVYAHQNQTSVAKHAIEKSLI